MSPSRRSLAGATTASPVELPGVTNDEEARAAEERIGQTARLTVHPVVATVASADAKPSKKGNPGRPRRGRLLHRGRSHRARG
ncbi:hypothetical protein [Nocardioides sp. B-3]|uniref:hypothetical protein n=1 Tax=Nocardioides sp. B-3 TaxID=2895565 RepID=UPI0021539CD5|nr:hypothetical protein [Nocardioides sp. B-3]UUZ60589.1 hypothetical protein LP418_06935 [Nocardioides sp. B-3]